MACFISLRNNGRGDAYIIKTYNRIKKFEVVEASEGLYFEKLPHCSKVADIEKGCDGTFKSIIRFNDSSFAVVEGI